MLSKTKKGGEKNEGGNSHFYFNFWNVWLRWH
jgi:hypothetical protein